MKLKKSFAALAVVCTAGGLLTGFVPADSDTVNAIDAVAGSAGTNAEEDSVLKAEVFSPPARRSALAAPTTIDPLGVWTEEALAQAVPLDIPVATETEPVASRSAVVSDEQTILSSPTVPEDNSTNLEATRLAAPVPNTVGKLYYKFKGVSYVCSAAVINGPTKNVIMTAGHCVHGGKGAGWHSDVVFRPAYHSGSSPNGLWNWSSMTTFQNWTNSSNYSYDQAFVKLHPRNGQNIVAAVGGNGLVTGGEKVVTNTRIWGYPAGSPFTGEVPYYCDGATRAAGGPMR
jgi:V8-like Glu-specific endopeptidase